MTCLRTGPVCTDRNDDLLAVQKAWLAVSEPSPLQLHILPFAGGGWVYCLHRRQSGLQAGKTYHEAKVKHIIQGYLDLKQ